ncbi:hypothetical protein DL768_010914 [Monosporascus sp. mg162]|nr:hypothetical protein DL768_010914 [Monosporascus sp. mg162]
MRLLAVEAQLALYVGTAWAVNSRQILAQQSCQTYAVQSGDTCQSISETVGVTWAQIISWNPEIDQLCSNLETFLGTDICITNPRGDFSIPTNTHGATSIATTPAPVPTPIPDGTNAQCGQYYLIGSSEDCSTITSKFNIELDDFLFLNPQVWRNCTNLWLDYYYCVQPVGTITTYPGHPDSSTTVPFVETPATAVPYVDLLENYTTSQPVVPLANGTRVDCHEYVWLANATDSAGAGCWGLAMYYDIEPEELVLWNPSLSRETADAQDPAELPYRYPCTLEQSVSYCVALAAATSSVAEPVTPPSPRAAGEVENCTAWYKIESWDTCEGVMALYGLDIEDFFAMNPAVGIDCTKMALGTFYCISTDPGGVPPPEDDDDGAVPSSSTSSTTTEDGISTPSPVQTGITSNCNEFHKVVTGDTCWDITQTYGIEPATFYSWNPAVGSDCAYLQLDVYVCVGIEDDSSPTTTTTSPPSSTVGTGIVTPTPTQDGMVKGCTSFYYVVAGDGCWAIANDHGIALDDFYKWNPAVGDDCSGLWPSVYVCVAVG